MGRLHEERLSGSGRGVENEGEGYLGLETIGDSKMGLVMKKKEKQKSTTGICTSLTPEYWEKEESNTNVTKAHTKLLLVNINRKLY